MVWLCDGLLQINSIWTLVVCQVDKKTQNICQSRNQQLKPLYFNSFLKAESVPFVTEPFLPAFQKESIEPEESPRPPCVPTATISRRWCTFCESINGFTNYVAKVNGFLQFSRGTIPNLCIGTLQIPTRSIVYDLYVTTRPETLGAKHFANGKRKHAQHGTNHDSKIHFAWMLNINSDHDKYQIMPNNNTPQTGTFIFWQSGSRIKNYTCVFPRGWTNPTTPNKTCSSIWGGDVSIVHQVCQWLREKTWVHKTCGTLAH